MATTKPPKSRARGKAGRPPLDDSGTVPVHMRWPQALRDAAQKHIDTLNEDSTRERTDFSRWVREVVRRELVKQGALE